MAIGWYVVEPPTSGGLAVSAKPATASMIGQLPTMGGMAVVVPKLTMAAIGTHPYTATMAAQAKAAIASFVGSQTIPGTIAVSAKPATAALAGVHANLGGLSALAKQATAALNGTVENRGALVALAKQATMSAAGGQTIPGTMAATMQKVTALFADGTAIGGAAMTLAKATAAMAGFQAQVGTLAAAGKPAVASLNGIEHPMGSLAAAAKPATMAGAGGQTMAATFAAALKKATAAMAGEQAQVGTMAGTLKKATFAGAQALTPVAYTGKDTLFVPNINPSTSLVYSANLTIPSGTGSVIITLEGTNLSGNPAADSIAATINGVAMTLISKQDGSGVNFTAALGMIAPPSGTQPLVLTFSGPNSTFRQMVGNTYYFTGGSSFGTPTTVVNNANTSPQTLTGPTGVTSSDMVHCVVGSYNSGAYVASSHTLLDNSSSGGFYSNIATMNAAGANSIAFSATPNVSSPYAAIAFAIKA